MSAVAPTHPRAATTPPPDVPGGIGAPAPAASRVALLLVHVVGVLAFTWPFLVAGQVDGTVFAQVDAPLVAAAIVGAALLVLAVELRRDGMSAATVAVLGVLAALAGLLRLADLPGGGSGIFFLVILAGVAYGHRFGLLLGLASMAVSAVVTGGIGPWLPFQMIGLAWIGAGAGALGTLTSRLDPRVELLVVVGYGWAVAFLYGALLNLSFWPFLRDGGALSFDPAAPLATTLVTYRAFYALTSFAWDAAGGITNAVLLALTGTATLRVLRRHADRVLR